jgi:hypothetical protein
VPVTVDFDPSDNSKAIILVLVSASSVHKYHDSAPILGVKDEHNADYGQRGLY